MAIDNLSFTYAGSHRPALRDVSLRISRGEPVAAPGFASNWEFPLARAFAVASELRRAGFADDIRAFGLGDTRFDELSLDLSVDERSRRARRIDIVVRRYAAKGGA